MSVLLAGQVVGVAFACGLNLYATVAALGILSRLGLTLGLPVGLQGLEGSIVIASALVLYIAEAIVDKIPHADSVWDALHTFIRPPAAALLAVGALWGLPAPALAAGSILALAVALTAHGSKAGLRIALNAAAPSRSQSWISAAEDVLAVAVAVGALRLPAVTFLVIGSLLALSATLGRRLWRAAYLGLRCIAAWLRSIFQPADWRGARQLPRYILRSVGETPLGEAPPRGARAALYDVPGAGAFRNGWLVLTATGPTFFFRSFLGHHRLALPPPHNVHGEGGVWANRLQIRSDNDLSYTIFMLKDGPSMELASRTLTHIIP
jgi:hypothetical protein